MADFNDMSDASTASCISEDIFTGKFSTAAGLDRIRRRLLDLTRSNPLLNYRFPKSKSLRIIDTPPDDLFNRLFDGKQAQIIPVPDPSTDEYEDNDGDEPAKPEIKAYAESRGIITGYELQAKRITAGNLNIQTLYYPEDLEALLRKIEQTGRTAIEESGTNMLYLVFGCLEWYESSSSEKPLLSPLLIMPVNLKRTGVDKTTGFFQYALEYTGEDIAENITLREKLKREFSLELPELEDDDTPEAYFSKIAAFIKPRPQWKLRRFCCLSLLSFGRLLMYLDLDPQRWPDNHPLHKHPIISSFFEGVDRSDSPGIAEEYRIDDEDDELRDIPIVYDADSSQHSALVDALKGKNLVIEGPPGTGKSQTITNLIVAALYEGKTVLFVSEKLAALEVVRRNLDRANLGDFCLALHSHKTQKKKLLEDVGARIEKSYSAPRELDNLISELKEKRNKLKQYAYLVNSSRNNRLGLTVHKVFWATERYRVHLETAKINITTTEIADAHDINAERFAELNQAVIQFARHLSEIGNYDTLHPWYGYYPSGMMFGDDARVGSILKDMNRMADSMQSCVCSAESYLENVDFKSHDNIKKLYQLITYEFPPISGFEVFVLLPDIALPGSVMIINRLEDNLKRVREYELLFKDNITSKQSISDDELEKARLMLGYAKTIKQQNTPYDQIISRCQALSKISTTLNDAVSAFSLIANSVGIAWDKTLQGALPIAAATKIASAAPLELLAMRDLTLMEPAAIGAIREAKEKASELITMRDTVNEQFEMSVLPPIEDITKAARVFKSGGGLFRIFKKEWRDAKKLYTGISRNAKSIKAAKCAEDLLFLINYLNSKNAFDNANYSTSIGAGFKGIDTDFSRLEQLIQWYEMAKAEFIASSSTDMTLQCREILFLPSDRLQWMASKGQEVTELLSFFDNTGNSVRQVFGASDIPDGLQNYRNLEGLCAELKLISDMMNQIGSFFSARFHISVSPAHALTVLKSAHDINTVKTSIENDREARALLGNIFVGLETDLKNVFATIQWASKVSSTGLPSDIRKWLLTPEATERLEIIRSLVCDLYGCWLKIEEHTTELGKFGELNHAQWYSSDVVTPDLIAKRTAIALDSMNSLVQWADFSRAFLQMNRYCLGDFSAAAVSGSVPASELHTYFNYCFYYSLAKHIMRQNPDLLLFSGIAQSQIRERFIELDEKVIKLNGQKCASTISWRDVPYGNSRGPVKTYTGKALILHELGKKSRHVPIRQLIRRAGKALQALKPCFMMGPLSVSQYLVPGELEFDMIIMDEASQLKPEDALGAVARGKQIVIVGDPKQLPPTSFFDSLINDTPTDEEDVQAAIDGAESILDISQFLFQPIRRLRWHYRSQHESLIAFSNRHFYDDHLVLFPSPHGPKSALGLRYNYVKNAVYVNRSNRLEAARVADAVIQHFQQNPHESLGVVTLNITQRDIIEEEIDRQLKQCEESMSYLAKWDEESYPFFIKNLENVQGDERDVIFISTTFGKGPEGVLRMNFGPITREMGWRRLNVLFTRAKKRVEVFSSMEPEDIRIEAGTHRGVRALKDYLSFAKSGVLESPKITSREPDSDFEVAVAEVLKNKGYEVVPQLGVAGFFLDMAVRNPEMPGDFLACIECDGATYHSGLSVRDRDRLRQQVLERLGWKGKIYRIWSSDWFKDPRTQTKRLVDFLEKLRIKARMERPVETPKVPEKFVVLTCVAIGDCVVYCDVMTPNDHKTVQIISGHADPKMGMIGENAPLAQVLLDSEIGDEVELSVPGSPTKTLRIIDIKKRNNA